MDNLPALDSIELWMTTSIRESGSLANGLAIIIGCPESCKKGHLSLAGVQYDVSKLKYTFDLLKFTTLCLFDPSKEHIMKVISCTSKMNTQLPPSWKRIVVTFSGHGDRRYLYAKDGVFELYGDLVRSLVPARARELSHIQKLFLIDACRGSVLDGGVEISQYSSEIVARGERVPSLGNYLVACSTLLGMQSFELNKLGGLWIQALSEQLLANDNIDKSFESILKRVNQILLDWFNKNDLDLQQPEYNSCLNGDDIKLLKEACAIEMLMQQHQQQALMQQQQQQPQQPMQQQQVPLMQPQQAQQQQHLMQQQQPQQPQLTMEQQQSQLQQQQLMQQQQLIQIEYLHGFDFGSPLVGRNASPVRQESLDSSNNQQGYYCKELNTFYQKKVITEPEDVSLPNNDGFKCSVRVHMADSTEIVGTSSVTMAMAREDAAKECQIQSHLSQSSPDQQGRDDPQPLDDLHPVVPPSDIDSSSGNGVTSSSHQPLDAITEADLASLMKLLQPVAAKWELLCLNLGVPMADLKIIASHPLYISGGTVKFLLEGLYLWLQRNSGTTISVLLSALQSIDENVLGHEIKGHWEEHRGPRRT